MHCIAMSQSHLEALDYQMVYEAPGYISMAASPPRVLQVRGV